MAFKDKVIRFVFKNMEACSVGLFAVLISLGLIFLAIGWVIAGVVTLLFCVAGVGGLVLLALAYRKWKEDLQEHNKRVSTAELKPGEHIVQLNQDQYEQYIREGYVVLPDGSPIVSEQYAKSGKMKHVKSADYEALNGPIITDKNKDYDGKRILDYEKKYGKNYGKKIEGGQS